MRVLVFGPNGQVGRAALRLANASGVEAIAAGRETADLSVHGAAAAAIAAARPDAVINAAAYTQVDKAESDADLCARLNRDAPGEMAEAAARLGAAFVHISTDYVFDGEGDGLLAEDAPTRPLNVYGVTKRDGETRVLAAGGRTAILRTSWVFSADGANFVKTMLRLSQTRDELTVVADQIGGPTPADAIAAACITLAQGLGDGGQGGVYHFQGAPAASWADFARVIMKAAGRATVIKDIPTSGYPTPARRPLRTVLDCSRIGRDYGVAAPDWRAAVDRTVAQLAAG